MGDNNGYLKAEKLADQLKYKLLKTHPRLLAESFHVSSQVVGPANVWCISLAFIRSSTVYSEVDVSC